MVLRGPHTARTQTNDQLPLFEHSVAPRLTRSAEKLCETHCEDYCPPHSSVYVLRLRKMQ